MKIIRHKGSGAWSRAVVHNGTIYFTGHVARPEYTTIEEQAKALTVRYDELLEEYGSDKHHIIMANMYFSNIDEGKVFERTFKEWLGDDMPSAVGIGVKLAADTYYAEVALIAALKEDE